MRLLPVTAHRLVPGDTIRTRDDGQIHVNQRAAKQTRTLAKVEVREHEKDGRVHERIHLVDTQGREWDAWTTDVAWLVMPEPCSFCGEHRDCEGEK